MMLFDNVEHIITYWVLFQTFQSPLLAGYAVISHWLPVLLFSIHSGALADRYDNRRIMQASLGVFMLASLCWAFLFLTDSLQIWEALVLLALHGFAVALWGPASQLILHDMVGPA